MSTATQEDFRSDPQAGTPLESSSAGNPVKPRVWWDDNAGGWCWQMPGRLPVQADSWAKAWGAVHAELWPAPPAPPAPPTSTTVRRWRWLGWLA